MKTLLIGFITLGTTLSAEPSPADPGITIEIDIFVEGAEVMIDPPDKVY